jgi:hypothetical protein
MIRHLAVFAIFAAGSALWSQTSPETAKTVRLDFTNPGLIPATWTIELHPDGSGHFRSQRGSAPRSSDAWLEPPDQDRDIRVGAALAADVFSTAAAKNFFQMQCESRDKVAFQGTKHLAYAGPDGRGECSFNYSRDRQIQQLGDQLSSVASTILEGARLERLHVHERLGLDQELQTFTEMLSDGRAAQPGVIRETLEALAADESLMERVRRRAREILAKAGN